MAKRVHNRANNWGCMGRGFMPNYFESNNLTTGYYDTIKRIKKDPRVLEREV